MTNYIGVAVTVAIALACPATYAQDWSAHPSVSFSKNENAMFARNQTNVDVSVISGDRGFVGRVGFGIAEDKSNAYETHTYSIGYHDDRYGRINYRRDRDKEKQGLFSSEGDTYAGDYYAQRVTLSMQHSRWKTNQDVSTTNVYQAHWYPDDNIALSGLIVRNEPDGSQSAVMLSKLWHLQQGAITLSAGHARRSASDETSVALSFRFKDHQSLISRHRSILNTAPFISLGYSDDRSRYIAVGYSF